MSCLYSSGEANCSISQTSTESGSLNANAVSSSERGLDSTTPLGPLPRAFRSVALFNIRSKLGHCVRIQDRIGGDCRTELTFDQPQAHTIRVNSPTFYQRFVLQGALGVAESYRKGEWDTSDLVGLFRVLARNLHQLTLLEKLSATVLWPLRKVRSWVARNTRAGSKRNISAHYDLSNEFFQLMLDGSMTYSSAIFSQPGMTLEQAQLEKYDQICRKLNLQACDRLIEIGTGWGGFAEHAAINYGCHVTTTTISEQQYHYARQRIKDHRLESRVNILKQDYRDLTGQYDKLVSIEMVEAVGHQYLRTYFEKCSQLLKPTGMMCLQAITIPDHRYDRYRRSVDFIQRYIFPGGCLPSFSAITNCLAKVTDFRLLHSQDFGFDYAATILTWRDNFWKNIEQVRLLGFDDQWIRTWDYYLCYCIAGFLERQIGVSQIVLAKPQAHQSPAESRNH